MLGRNEFKKKNSVCFGFYMPLKRLSFEHVFVISVIYFEVNVQYALMRESPSIYVTIQEILINTL